MKKYWEKIMDDSDLLNDDLYKVSREKIEKFIKTNSLNILDFDRDTIKEEFQEDINKIISNLDTETERIYKLEDMVNKNEKIIEDSYIGIYGCQLNQ